MPLQDPLAKFQPGVSLVAQLTAGRLNAFLDEIASCRMRPGVGYGFNRDSGGTSLTIISNSSSAVVLKLQAVNVGAATVIVTPGTYHSVVPTIGGTAINAATPPQLTITTTGVIYAHLIMTDTTTNAVTSVEILNAASLPTSTATDVYQTIATVTLTAGVIAAPANALAGSQDLLRCGSSFAFGSV
jgi:hypothetical protein